MNPGTVRTAAGPRLTAAGPVRATIPADWDWPRFWDHVHRWMRAQGYARSTAILYRQVLRNLARFASVPPASVDRAILDRYFARLRRGQCSPHWAAVNFSTLRTVFDKLFGLGLLRHRRGPRHPDALPEILSAEEALALLKAASTLRDRLLIGLLYGCGLTTGELRALRWQDLDPKSQSVHAPGDLRLNARVLRLPESLVQLVATARNLCGSHTPVLPGRLPGTSLSARQIQLRVRSIAREAGILKPVSPRSLRQTYAVHTMEAGGNVRELQICLGHCCLSTTLRYTRCSLPEDARSPIDIARMVTSTAGTSEPDEVIASATLARDAGIAVIARSAREFLHTLHCQLGDRFLSLGKASTGPPKAASSANRRLTWPNTGRLKPVPDFG